MRTRLDWHRAVSETLEREVDGQGFVLLLRVNLEGNPGIDVNALAEGVSAWLAGLDASKGVCSSLRPLEKLDVEIQAIPGPPTPRRLIANPNPTGAHWAYASEGSDG